MRFRTAVWLAIFVAGLSLTATAQEDFGRGRINGVVLDENGAPVDGALIVAESERGGD